MCDVNRNEEYEPFTTALATAFRWVLIQWRVTLVREQPWRSMPADDVFGEMSKVLKSFAATVSNPTDGAAHRRLIGAAHEHGAFRRRQRCDLEVVGSEFGTLSVILNRAAQDARLDSRMTVGALCGTEGEMWTVLRFAALGWRDPWSSPPNE
jgi:hypothetical protein